MERYNNIIEFKELSSTNDYAVEITRQKYVPDFTVVRSDFQTKGRGQIGNAWVSNAGENLLFSVVLHPTHIPANNQFILSQSVALAVRNTVSCFCEDVYVKWPNDVYVGQEKIAGILIENLLSGKIIETSIVGIGLNVNQTEFLGVPNPTSLCKHVGQRLECGKILELFLDCLRKYYTLANGNAENIREEYLQNLYLRETPNLFRDSVGTFMGTIVSVDVDGRIHIVDDSGLERKYYFKEVEYCIS